ncbi:class E sortase [Streptomyces sp. NPDC017254]|uniref:class E sortase n=1 Tax=unclassified Streptomyces TaxID=2593676 RepID=UPI0037AD2551
MTTGSPWFRGTNEPGPEPIPVDPYAAPSPYTEPVASPGYGEAPAYEDTAPYGQAPATEQTYREPRQAYQEPQRSHQEPQQGYQEPQQGYQEPHQAPQEPQQSYQAPEAAYEAPYKDPYAPSYEPYEAEQVPRSSPGDTTVLEAVEPLSGPGRAERRRAAKGGRGKSRRGGPPTTPSGTSPAGPPAAPLSRVEARRAARAAKDSVGVVASRAVGELFITFGVVMLLFVTYQLWWTNVLAGQETDRAKEQIEDTWAKGEGEDDGRPGAFEPGEGFAIMYIPKLDVVVPVAEGISKTKVLDKGMVGHYGEGKLKTAMPSDKQGNFAVAGHRNTHGEPFRYINQLKPGDPIVVETQNAYYTYEMASILPQTSPSNVSVIDPVPKGSGFNEPGRFITLTTCTPEFTSTYRMIVWGRLVEERPRSQGKPKALVG